MRRPGIFQYLKQYADEIGLLHESMDPLPEIQLPEAPLPDRVVHDVDAAIDYVFNDVLVGIKPPH